MNIIGKRYYFFALSALLIIPGLIALFSFGLPLGIDFTGGSKLEIQLDSPVGLGTDPVAAVLADQGFDSSVVQLSGEDVVIIRTADMTDPQKTSLVEALSARFETDAELLSFESVGPTIGTEVARRAVGVVAIATLGILGYVTFAFRGVENAFRYGVCAIFALVHDSLIVISAAAILGRIFGWEVDALFITALLTVIGFSVHDSIVVFDRVRENLTKHRRASYETVVNHSVVQSLTRSVNTQVTSLLALFSIALFTGGSLRTFVVTMMIGLISGTYSSLCNAAPILVVWENKEWKTWFGGGK